MNEIEGLFDDWHGPNAFSAVVFFLQKLHLSKAFHNIKRKEER
jgi:hypothetical protein